MNPFHKSASLHYVTFIEPLVIFSIDALLFNFKQFKNISINKENESKIKDPFLLLDEHFFAADLVYTKRYEVQFKGLSHEVLKFFS
jgi:hypothetical protein